MTGLLEKKYLTTHFNVNAKQSAPQALEKALKHLEQLKIKYKNLDEERKELRRQLLNESIEAKQKAKDKEKNPYIIGRRINGKLCGWFVEGYLDNNGQPYPKKEFSTLSDNRRNKEAAERYIKELEIKNKDAVFKEYIPEELVNYEGEEGRKRWKGSAHMPNRITYTDSTRTGYMVKNFKTANDELISQKFCDPKKSKEEKYQMALDTLTKLIKEKKEALLLKKEIDNNDVNNV